MFSQFTRYFDAFTRMFHAVYSFTSIDWYALPKWFFFVLFLFTRTGSFYLCPCLSIAIAFTFVLNDKCCPGKKWFSIKFSCTPENDIFYCIYSSEQSYQQSFVCVCAVFCSFCFVFIETKLEPPMCKYTFLRAIQYSILAYGWISSNRLNIGIHTG